MSECMPLIMQLIDQNRFNLINWSIY